MAKKRILVTGGAGFIGSHLVDSLAQDHQVVVVDDFSVGVRENLAQHARNPDVHIVEADVRDAAAMQQLCQGIDVVYHLATQGVRISIRNPQIVHEVNVTGTLNVCQAALDQGVGRLVYVSSSEVYGTAQSVPMSERHPTEPHTIYGASKLAGEYYAKAFYRTHQLPVIVVRPFNTYGPRSHFEGVYGEAIPRFVLRLLDGAPPVIFGDGTQTRDFTYVTDTVRGLILAGACDDLIGQVVNLGYGAEISIRALAEKLVALINPTVGLEHDGPRPGDVLRLYADISLARDKLGYQPEVSLDEGLQRYIEWFRQHVDIAQARSQEQRLNW